ncbi:DegT/DnrJ/EryC1/StrS family aminotransferase [Amycolatopsis panacis]|uniref:DegT/DnrJ/EryC1/StrS aminotransferase family protein n=1 Tax=Amycolatopsis panacis TaxID=2340917 RepID=A0A419HXB3_9PSEU|nr:DegT/DnrJ/EryC1/StrS aminotransferase family protein [Amycolatopsis panacis]RJQ81686.1 DegT/DnrJ/EryC1/StrS aminotransferase family protein [Amycolatopsis panacis]
MNDQLVPPYRICLDEGQVRQAVDGFEEVLRGGTFVLGPKTRRFEQEFGALVLGREVTAVSTGTVALEMIFRGIGVHGRDILVPANTNFATARAVTAAGGRPVLYDAGLLPSVTAIEQALTPQTAAVTVVHIGGHVSPELPALCSLLDKVGIPLVEDAAHAHGSTLGGVSAGAFGAAAAFSFFPTKVVTTFEGGAVVTRDAELTRLTRMYRNQGKDAHGLHVVEGNSWRLSEVGAVLGLVQLRRFRADQRRREQILDRYRVELDPCPGIRFPTVPAGAALSGHKAIALLAEPEHRTQFRQTLALRGVGLAGGVYEVPLHRQPVFEHLGAGRRFPEADAFAAAHICLPMWASMSDREVGTVIDAVAAAVRDD